MSRRYIPWNITANPPPIGLSSTSPTLFAVPPTLIMLENTGKPSWIVVEPALLAPITCSCPVLFYLDSKCGNNSADKSVCARSSGQRYGGKECVRCEAGVVPGEGDCYFRGLLAALNPEKGRWAICNRKRRRPTFDETCKFRERYFYFTGVSLCCWKRSSFPGSLSKIPQEVRPCPEGSPAFRGRSETRCRREQEQPSRHFTSWTERNVWSVEMV